MNNKELSYECLPSKSPIIISALLTLFLPPLNTKINSSLILTVTAQFGFPA